MKLSQSQLNQSQRIYVRLERLNKQLENVEVGQPGDNQVINASVFQAEEAGVKEYDPELDLSQEVEESEMFIATTQILEPASSPPQTANFGEFSMNSLIEESFVKTPPKNPIPLASESRGKNALSRGASEERPEQAKLYLSPTLELPQMEDPTRELKALKATKDVDKDLQEKSPNSLGKLAKVLKAEHSQTLELKSPKRFACYYCNEKFSTKSTLQEHMKMELAKKMEESREKMKQEDMEKERKRKDSKLKRRQKRSSISSPAADSDKCQLKSEILKVPRSLAMLEDKLSPHFMAEGRRVRRPPNVFSTESDARTKQKALHEEESSDEEDQDDDDEENANDDAGESQSSDIIIEELKPGEVADRQASVPKRLSLLEDKLTGYFSPKGGKRRRKSPERLSLNEAVSSGTKTSRGRVGSGGELTPLLARKRPLPRSVREEADVAITPETGVETSTPLEGRSVRNRPRISYVEVPDTNAFDLSTGDEESPFERRFSKKQPKDAVAKTRQDVDLDERWRTTDIAADTRSPRRFILGSSRRRRELDESSASSGASSRVRVTTGKQDLSQEIVDLSGSGNTEDDAEEGDLDLESPPRPSHPLPPKSPGKYQSSVTPGRGIKLMINR